MREAAQSKPGACELCGNGKSSSRLAAGLTHPGVLLFADFFINR
jgi:hypothetical protein